MYQIADHFSGYRASSGCRDILLGRTSYVYDTVVARYKSSEPAPITVEQTDEPANEQHYCSAFNCSGCNAVLRLLDYYEITIDTADSWKSEAAHNRLGQIYGSRVAQKKREIADKDSNDAEFDYRNLYEQTSGCAAACALINYFRRL